MIMVRKSNKLLENNSHKCQVENDIHTICKWIAKHVFKRPNATHINVTEVVATFLQNEPLARLNRIDEGVKTNELHQLLKPWIYSIAVVKIDLTVGHHQTL